VRRYIYRLREDELGELLAENPVPVEILNRDGEWLTFAVYDPLEGIEPLSSEEVDEGWKDWRQGFGPVEVDDFLIVPPWKKVVFINPGMAFGTGFHPTTRLCIRMLKETLKEGDSILDVGTGSGVLAIVSRLLGAGRVVGIDISKDALRACEENARLNGVEVETLLGRPGELAGSFDVVVANLELQIFEKELPDILRLVGRQAVLSGIYRRDELLSLLDLLGQEGFQADRILEEEDWYCVRVGHAGD